MAAGVESTRTWRAVRAAEERVQGLETLRRDLRLLERKAQSGLREVIEELSRRWSSQVYLGGATVLRSGESLWGENMALARNAQETRDFVATMTGGRGDITAGAVGPIERLQRRVKEERARAEARRAVARALKEEAEKAAEKEKAEKEAAEKEAGKGVK